MRMNAILGGVFVHLMLTIVLGMLSISTHGIDNGMRREKLRSILLACVSL